MSYPAIDSTAVRWSVPRDEVARELADRPLLIMMHGFGSHEGDLFPLAQYLPEKFVVASLRAPNQQGPGFAWFALAPDPVTGSLKRDLNEVAAATTELISWIDELEREVGELPNIALLGFSQGGVMVTQLLRYQPTRFTAAVLLASFALNNPSPEAAGQDAVLAETKPPVFWGRDTEDPVITPDLIDFTRRWLPEHSELTSRLYSHIGHGISMEEVEDVRAFLEENAL